MASIARECLLVVTCAASLLCAAEAHAAWDGPAPRQAPGLAGGPRLVLGETPEETYELNFVGIQHTEIGGYGTARGYVAKTEYWQGFRGKFKQMLGPVEFYDAVARPDLHAAATHHFALQIGCAAGGLGLILGGVIYAGKQMNTHGSPTFGFILMGSGAVLELVARGMTSQPTTEAEARAMAVSYNDRLRAHLGLPPIIEDPTAPEARAQPRPRPRRFGILPSVGPGGAGLLFAGVF
jgi:hypothetical protein